MALPKQSTPIYELTVPSTNKKVKYRPFLVKDTKALLIALQSEDETVAVDTLRDVIKNCITTKVDINSLALFDIEYIFCMLRAKSVGELIELNVKCQHCGKQHQTTIDISKVEVEKKKEHTNKFTIFDDVGICMRYPNYELLNKFKEKTVDEVNQLEMIFDIILECVDYIYDKEQMYKAKETSREELEDFFYNLTREQLEKVVNFFQTMPKIKKDVVFSCSDCSEKNVITLEGIKNFF